MEQYENKKELIKLNDGTIMFIIRRKSMKERQSDLLNRISINFFTISLIVTFMSSNAIPAYASEENPEHETIETKSYDDDQDFIDFLMAEGNNLRFNSESKTVSINDLPEMCFYGNVVLDDTSKSMRYLNDFHNMEELIITDYSYEPKLLELDGNNFRKPITIDLWIPYEYGSLCDERYPFLKAIPNIDTLILGDKTMSEDIDFEFLESLTNVHHLKLGIGMHTNLQKIDFSSFDSVELIGYPYDIAMYLSNEDIEEIQKSTNLIIENIESVKSVNNEIKEIAEELNLYDNLSPQEKLNRILEYIFTNLTYDDVIENENINEQYYSKGFLTAALEGEKQVCGNYAALLKILCREAGINCINLMNDIHAWNAVELNGYYYSIDATEIDNSCEIISTELGVFLESNDDYKYDLVRTPEGLELGSIPPRIERINLSNDKDKLINLNGEVFKITINKKIYYVTAIELIPILEALGIAVNIGNKSLCSPKKQNSK